MIEFQIASSQMKEVEELISGTEIDLSELESRANQPKIVKQFKIIPQELSISARGNRMHDCCSRCSLGS